jgi:hypothetical protein
MQCSFRIAFNSMPERQPHTFICLVDTSELKIIKFRLGMVAQGHNPQEAESGGLEH